MSVRESGGVLSMRFLKSLWRSFSGVAALAGAGLLVAPAYAVELRTTANDVIGAPALQSSTFERPQYVLGPEKWGSQVLGTPGDIPWSFFDPANGVSRLQPTGAPYVSVPMMARPVACSSSISGCQVTP